MSFLFGGPPKMSSAEKIAAAETEVEMVTDMFNRYAIPTPTQTKSGSEWNARRKEIKIK